MANRMFVRLIPCILGIDHFVFRSKSFLFVPDWTSIRNSVGRRFDIDSVGVIKSKDIKVTKQDGGYLVTAIYADKTPFIANVSFVVDFDKQALIRK